MTITNGYTTLADLKAHLGDTRSDADAQLEAAIESASREIDGYCRRRFYVDTLGSTRVYRPVSSTELFIDDASAVTAVKTDEGDDGTYETTWSASDYVLGPFNGIGSNGAAGWPYVHIKAVGSRTFPMFARPTVQVTATWGWAAVPADVAAACRLLAATVHESRLVPFGSAAIGEVGMTRTRMPALVAELLAPYVLRNLRVA